VPPNEEQEPAEADLETTVSWDLRDQANVERALLVAMDALDERNASSHDLLLEGASLLGLIDPSRLRAQIASDDQATTVLRALLAHRTEAPSESA
jgi:hypothetical protein